MTHSIKRFKDEQTSAKKNRNLCSVQGEGEESKRGRFKKNAQNVSNCRSENTKHNLKTETGKKKTPKSGNGDRRQKKKKKRGVRT